MPFEFGEEPFDLFSTTMISCAVTKGDLPIDVSWLFNDVEILNSFNGITITKSGQRISMLTIDSVQPAHAGNYSCVARNRAGEAQHSSHLKVIGNLALFNLPFY